DPRHGKFSNDRSLPREERDALLAWIEQRCPKGDDKDLPPSKKLVEGWQVGYPDAIFTMRKEFKVPAHSTKERGPYTYFRIMTNVDTALWIQAVEGKARSRRAVNHMAVYMIRPDRKNERNLLNEGLLGGYVPGNPGESFPPGAARKIPKGSELFFVMHYTPNGTEQVDKSSVGLVFAKKPPKHEIRSRAVLNADFVIPPGAANHKVMASYTFDKEILVWGYLPPMHLRGKSFEYKAVYPDGKAETLLSVPRYDFGWQTTYRLKEPLRLPAGTRIECTAHFDNSAGNRN